jgi:N-acetylglucosaminyldiphosphoundecaprenol N-acetyl-beta-D-mannosaminyltransferase
MHIERREFLGMRFDPLSADQALARLAKVTGETPYSYVVTPNVDHVVRLHEKEWIEAKLRAIYDEADLCLCDSKVLHTLARLRGVRLPVLVGTDLASLVFERLVEPGDRIAIVGGSDTIVRILERKYPLVEFVQHTPPMGLRRNPAARRAAAKFIAKSGARFSFIAVGSPQQELIAAEVKCISGAVGTAFCIGAALDFITGQQRRAPRLARLLGLEWAHRLVSDPRRMWRRYLLEGPRVFLLAYRWAGAPHRSAASK